MDRILAPLLNKSNTNLPFFTRAPSCGVLRNIDNQPMEKRTPKPRASREAKMEPVHLKEAADLKALFSEHITKRLGWSQETFAEKLKIGGQGNVSHYLGGRQRLNLVAARKFASAMGVPISSFSPRLAEENDAYELAAANAGTPQVAEPAHTPEEQAEQIIEAVRTILRIANLPDDCLGAPDSLRAALTLKEPQERYSLAELEETLRGLHQDKPAAFRNARPDELFSVLANRLRGEGKADPQNATESPATNVASIPTK